MLDTTITVHLSQYQLGFLVGAVSMLVLLIAISLIYALVTRGNE